MRILARILLVQIFACATIMAQGTAIVPNENLIVEGVPIIPAALSSTVGRSIIYQNALKSGHQTDIGVLMQFAAPDVIRRISEPRN